MAFTLPNLPYAHEALEPHIDTLTMQIHHGKHHQAYVDNLNKAIAGTDNENKSLEELVKNAGSISPAVRNNGGGHWNHTFFWEILAPNAGGAPSGKLAEAINENNNGPTQEAIDLINEVRDRAEIGPLPGGDTSSKETFNDAILRERAWELYFEGLRFFDLRRHDKWESAVGAVSGKDPGPALFPIPQYAVDDGCAQNAEYAN